MSRRALSVLALPVGVSVAAAATGFQLLCQGHEHSGEKKASEKEEKETKNRWYLSSLGKGTKDIKPCNLTGWWENDLGSKVQVFRVDNDGTFSGEYHTAVSTAKKPIQPSPLTGSQHLDEDGQCTFGFTVNWKKFSVSCLSFPDLFHSGWCLQTAVHLPKQDLDSTAVFVGQCFNGDDGKEVLHTSWLLREKVDSEGDDWKATRTGHNTFTRMG